MIVSVDNINNLLKHEGLRQEDLQKETYIISAFAEINESIKEHFDDNYLLHRAYFSDDEKPFTPIKFDDIKFKQSSLAIDHIDFAEKTIINNKIKSFAEILLKKSLQGLILYKGPTPYKLGDVIYQDLHEENAAILLSNKLDVPLKDIDILFQKYKLHSNAHESSFYTYFIRPFANHKHYNGVFLIVLTRSLDESEFTELGHLWTKILSETALLKVERLSRAAEQEFIFEEHTHTWNTEIASIIYHLHIAFNKYKTKKGEDISKEIFKNLQSAYLQVQQLRTTNTFNLFLMKTRGLESRSEIENIFSHLSDQNLFKELQIKPISLKKVLIESILTLYTMLKSLEYIDVKTTKKELIALMTLRKQVKSLPNLKIKTINTALRIIILDLLKNALLHADSVRPEIKIEIDKRDDNVYIHIINNSVLSKEAFNYINSNADTNNISLRRKGGIRTIKRILASPLIGSSSARWSIMADECSLIEKTKIILIIPKTDTNG